MLEACLQHELPRLSPSKHYDLNVAHHPPSHIQNRVVFLQIIQATFSKLSHAFKTDLDGQIPIQPTGADWLSPLPPVVTSQMLTSYHIVLCPDTRIKPWKVPSNSRVHTKTRAAPPPKIVYNPQFSGKHTGILPVLAKSASALAQAIWGSTHSCRKPSSSKLQRQLYKSPLTAWLKISSIAMPGGTQKHLCRSQCTICAKAHHHMVPCEIKPFNFTHKSQQHLTKTGVCNTKISNTESHTRILTRGSFMSPHVPKQGVQNRPKMQP